MPSWPAAAGRAAAALTAVAALSTTVAAQAGILPRPVQNLAHYITGAAQTRPPALPAVVRAGAESLLCTAYQHARQHDQGAALTAALRRMVTQVAGSAAAASAYCAAVQLPAVPARPDPAPVRSGPASAVSTGGDRPAWPGHGKAHRMGQGNGQSQSGHGNPSRHGPGNGDGNRQGSSARPGYAKGQAGGNGNGNGQGQGNGAGDRAGHSSGTGPGSGNGQGHGQGNGQGNGNGRGHGHG